MTSRAVVSCGVGAWHPRGQARLAKSLAPFGEQLIHWSDEYPPGSPTHQDSPYVFKVYAMLAASEQADLLLWVDSSFWAVKRLDPIWAHIERIGYLFWREGDMLGQWTSDMALKRFGYTRDAALKMNLVTGGIYGLDMRRQQSQEFLARLRELADEGVVFPGSHTNKGGEASDDNRCVGHRHDMCAMSYLAREMNMTAWITPPNFFALAAKEGPEHPAAIFVARGM